MFRRLYVSTSRSFDKSVPMFRQYVSMFRHVETLGCRNSGTTRCFDKCPNVPTTMFQCFDMSKHWVVETAVRPVVSTTHYVSIKVSQCSDNYVPMFRHVETLGHIVGTALLLVVSFRCFDNAFCRNKGLSKYSRVPNKRTDGINVQGYGKSTIT